MSRMSPRARLKKRSPRSRAPSEPEELRLPFRQPQSLTTDGVEIVKRSNEKLDEAMIRRICALVQKGFTLSATCDYLSITPATLYKWRRNGETYLDGDCQPREFEKYGILLLSLRKALAVALMDLQDGLMNSDIGWVKYLAILERRDPMNFGKDQGNPEDDIFDASEEFL